MKFFLTNFIPRHSGLQTLEDSKEHTLEGNDFYFEDGISEQKKILRKFPWLEKNLNFRIQFVKMLCEFLFKWNIYNYKRIHFKGMSQNITKNTM